MDHRAEAWYRRRTSHWRDWPLGQLLENKQRDGTRISVVIPARNEERTVAGVVGPLAQALVADAPLADELSGILAWIEQLNEVDTEGVEPMTSAVAAKLPWREDVVNDGGDPERVLSNAPRRDRNFFVVPKVVE